jgi:hypothetical protein
MTEATARARKPRPVRANPPITRIKSAVKDVNLREDIRRIFNSAKANNNPQKRLLDAVFGREFSRCFRHALMVLRKTGDRRESGHPSIVHALEVSLGVMGISNVYGLVELGPGAARPMGETITPRNLMEMKGEDYWMKAMCVAILHDVVEDSSRSAVGMKQGFKLLRGVLSPYGKDFAQDVIRGVRLLTNKHARLLKAAQRGIHETDYPIGSVRLGLETVRRELELGDRLGEYVKRLDALIADLDRLEAMEETVEEPFVASYHARVSAVSGIMDYLSFKAYNHFTRELLRACIEAFEEVRDTADIPLLVKLKDAMNNTETTNVSNRRRIRRSLAKAEMVGRRIDSVEAPYEESRDIAHIPDGSTGWIQYLEGRDNVDLIYIENWKALAMDLRCAMIRACIVRREAIKALDVGAMVAEMHPFLARLELKYRELYGILPEHGRIAVVQRNPVAKLWVPGNGTNGTH